MYYRDVLIEILEKGGKFMVDMPSAKFVENNITHNDQVKNRKVVITSPDGRMMGGTVASYPPGTAKLQLSPATTVDVYQTTTCHVLYPKEVCDQIGNPTVLLSEIWNENNPNHYNQVLGFVYEPKPVDGVNFTCTTGRENEKKEPYSVNGFVQDGKILINSSSPFMPKEQRLVQDGDINKNYLWLKNGDSGGRCSTSDGKGFTLEDMSYVRLPLSDYQRGQSLDISEFPKVKIFSNSQGPYKPEEDEELRMIGSAGAVVPSK